jgi:hypothetical protein
MSCPVCDREMILVSTDGAVRRTWWCRGCGTLRERVGDFDHVETPANVRRVIEAAKLGPGAAGETQAATVEARFRVHQEGGGAPRVEQTVFRSNRLPPREAEA